MKTPQDRREAAIVAAQNTTDYQRGIIAGHYTGRRHASYLRTHTRCTRGHGWTAKGMAGGCAICEKGA